MKKLPFKSHGKTLYSLVDDDVYKWAKNYNWHGKEYKTNYRTIIYVGRYIQKNYRRKFVKLHQLVIGMSIDGKLTDHKNRNSLDNQRHNLRFATSQENSMNASPYKNKKHKGIIFRKDMNKWRSRIRYNNKLINIGHFVNKNDALNAYNMKAKELFKNFAVLNKA